MTTSLPILALKSAFSPAIERGTVVVTASTGSGKSTEVPRWCPKPVVVVEPRRVACRALAHRVAELEKTRVSERVGYVVRDEARVRPHTEITFATPGIVLRQLDKYFGYETVVLDEVHERTLDTDLLLALARGRVKRLVVMSATIDGPRLAKTLDAELLHAEGRTYPVDISYDKASPTVPSTDRLASRVSKVVQSLQSSQGDILVFLPGKAEIRQVKNTLPSSLTTIELHGSMSPEDQAKAFKPGPSKIILSTNVAETSVTVPGVRTVIDTGLVRQVRYLQGRGTLTLRPIARDAADQRAGRAGRVAAGRCIRLWQPNAHLEAHTQPEVRRMSLVPLVLATRAAGHAPDSLPWLDPPPEHAVEQATHELQALGALDNNTHITPRGQALFQLPVDPWWGRMLVEAEARSLLEPTIDLISVLSLGRSIFTQAKPEEEDIRLQGCDIIASVTAIRQAYSPANPVDRFAQREALSHRTRLRRAFQLSETPPTPHSIDRRAMLSMILAADPRSARVIRSRGKTTAWGGSGTEMVLDPRSAIAIKQKSDPNERWPDAILVLNLRSQTEGTRSTVIATAAAPVPLSQLDEMGLGTPSIGRVYLNRGKILATIERVYAGRVLGSEEKSPKGQLLRSALSTLMAQGTIYPGIFTAIEQRLSAHKLARRLIDAQMVKAYEGDKETLLNEDNPKAFIEAKLQQLGLEHDEDRELIDETDLLPPALLNHIQAALDRDYPQQVDLGEAKYSVRYDLGSRRAVLMLTKGRRKSPPPRNYLPRFPGLKVSIQAGGSLVDLG